jgi:hypothetical protein
MSALALQVFVSLTLAAGGGLLFIYSWRQRDGEHHDRLSLLPLEDDPTTPSSKPAPQGTNHTP